MRYNIIQMRCDLNQWASTHVDNLLQPNICPKQQHVVLVYVEQAAVNRACMRTASNIQKQHVVQQAAYSSSKQCGTSSLSLQGDVKHAAAAEQAATRTSVSSDTQLLLLHEVTTTAAAWGLRPASATHYCTAVCSIQLATATVPGTYTRVSAYVHQYTFIPLVSRYN